ncbi:CDP-diacylglycerol--glycerol-3-phosphate 3-phosphatidyltransferase [bacterium BMS3Abin09]|nr:CDP-diacylglycerol--glycerol-3-phosphate 3-phosphatidyltransferase [bacterium BMS3Abin09]GBE41124.1 CDP-diacylglycerol--glycerol-3-phosphate 3-phosphatidyltransferase [bacterium BMS3Bbin09]
MVNIPIIITLSRMLIIIPFVLIAPDNPYVGGVIFSIAALTDYFDGHIARKRKQVTKLGMFLDPVADKLLVISALIIFVDMELIPAWIAIVIIAREFIITGLRVVALSKDIVIPAEMGGKIKVTAQIASIIVLFADRAFVNIDFYPTGIVLLWIAMVLGILSGIQYFVIFWKKYD